MHFKATKYLVKNYLGLFFCLSLYAFFAIPMGMVTIPTVLFVSLYYLPNITISCIKKRPLKVLTINYSLWFFVFVAMMTFHHFQAKAKESHAHSVLNIIEEYFDQHNQYPKSIEVLKPQLPKTKYQVFYHNVKGKPVLFYSSNYDPFINHQYRFSEKKWIMWSKD